MVYVDDSGYRADDPKRVGDQSFDQSRVDKQYAAIMSGEPDWDEKLRDPKNPPRIKADQNEWQRLRAEKVNGQRCRLCDSWACDPHHLVPRGRAGLGGGDDIADNLVGLCRLHHRLVENRDVWARSLLGARLTDGERAYVVGKRGAYWLERNYGVKEERAA